METGLSFKIAYNMKWVILLSLIIGHVVHQPSIVLKVSNGLIRGRISEDGNFIEYLGIPYGRTTPETRFQGPLSEPTWDGIFDAVDEHVRCPQRITDTVVIGQEDCLVLNVYVPTEAYENEPLPVMIFIHGGGFYEGSGFPSLYGPEYLVNHKVILVTINYRVNIQGFLCLGIKEAPGNVGLKDQVASFRWVQRNIAAFGGDPNSVTIFGESAGSASVSYHLLSPMSKGLFQKAILQSGSSIAPWANQYDSINMAYLLAKQLGHNTKDPYHLYNIFMNTSYRDLIVTRVPRPKGNIIISELLYIPCVENEIEGVEAFITDFPYNLLKKGLIHKIPVIVGYNSNEGYLFLPRENETSLAKIDIVKALPNNMYFPNIDERKIEGERVRKFYFGSKKIDKNSLLELSDYIKDPYFKYPTIAETDLMLQNNQTIFSYEFRYDGWLNLAKFTSGMKDAAGATHADELFYLFKPRSFPSPHRVLEADMIKKMTTMWTNFAKFGKPIPEVTLLLPVKWDPVNKIDPQVFVIDREFTTKSMWIDKSMLFWREMYEKYRSEIHKQYKDIRYKW